MRMMIYQESSLILNRFLTSFFEIYSYSVEKSPPGSVEDYLRGTYFEEALLMSDIASKARVHPPKDLATYIQGIGKDITQRAEKCLDKYSLLISPHIAKSIHECFLESPFVNQMLLLPNTINARKNLPFPDSLIYHLPPLSDKEKENIIGMYNLLNSEHKKLKRSFSDGILRQLAQTDFIINRPPEWSYWYRISPEKLQAQIKAFNDWRSSGGDKE